MAETEAVIRRAATLAAALTLLVATNAHAVIHGTDAGGGNLPWQVAVILDGTGLCGGTLLSTDTVLTAAHCTAGESASTLQVRSGSALLDSDYQLRDVIEIADHPNTMQNGTLVPRRDVSVLRLAPLAPGTTLKGAPLAAVAPGDDDPLWDTGKALTVSGFGVTQPQGAISSTLQSAVVDRVSDDACRASYSDTFDSSDMVCAAGPTTASDGLVADSCNGDSGGPLAAPAIASANPATPADWRLMGVTSWGFSCGDPGHPGVYARVGDGTAPDSINSFIAANGTVLFKPRNMAPPTVAGKPAVGETLRCQRGAWEHDGSSTFYVQRWSSPTDTNPDVLPSGGAYVVTPADSGTWFSCLEAVQNASGTTSASSSLVGPVSARVPQVVKPPSPPSGHLPVPARDKAAPRATTKSKRCRRSGTCSVVVLARDKGPAGVRGLVAELTGTFLGRARHADVRIRRLSSTLFEVRTDRLPRGTWTLRITAVDRAGNRQRRATIVKLRAR